MDRTPTHEPFAHVIVKLLQDTLYDENEKVWNDLLQYQIPITQYFDKIAIDLILEKEDGYAYLKQIELDEEKNTKTQVCHYTKINHYSNGFYHYWMLWELRV